MKTFVTRSLSAIVFAVVMLGGMVWNEWSFTILFFVINAGMLWEYYKLIGNFYSSGKIKPRAYQYIGVTMGSLFYIAFSGFALLCLTSVGVLFSFLIPLLFIVLIIELFAQSEKGITNAALSALGIIYISVPMGLLQCIAGRGTNQFWPHNNILWFPEKIGLVLEVLLLIWANDTFAYIGGSLIGRHKLFPSISPGKTWEGFFVGVLGSVLAAYVLSIFLVPLSTINWVIIALIVSVFGTLGDLFESMLKRNAGVKDSGSIMPGHGGFLDRFDAFIFCIPFVFIYLRCYVF